LAYWLLLPTSTDENVWGVLFVLKKREAIVVNLLVIIAIVLLVLWLLGLVTGALGGLIYILLVIAIILFIIWLVQRVIIKH